MTLGAHCLRYSTVSRLREVILHDDSESESESALEDEDEESELDSELELDDAFDFLTDFAGFEEEELNETRILVNMYNGQTEDTTYDEDPFCFRFLHSFRISSNGGPAGFTSSLSTTTPLASFLSASAALL